MGTASRPTFGRLTPAAAALVVLVLLLAGAATADVVVLANRTNGRLTVQVQPRSGRHEQLSIPAGDVVPYFSDGRVRLQFTSRGQSKSYRLDANSAYYFGQAGDGRVDLQKIGLGGSKSEVEGRPLPGTALSPPSATIPVKILVDEEEPGRQFLWERRLRARIEAASAILDRYCRIRLQVVAVGTWDSDDATTDFIASLGEFEREVNPFPARLAIGFTSQYHFQRGRVHLAGTRGPLQAHILVREAARNINEAERLELLVHELGHYLGASHSPERKSVMRPVLGDKQAGRPGFRIHFDPVNALAIAMVGEEIRRRRIDSFADLTIGTKTRLRQVYGELSRAFPKDQATKQFIMTVDAATAVPIVDATRRVLAEIVQSAQANRDFPPEADTTQQPRRDGDALTEYYVRRAARAADALPDEVGPSALLLALGIGLDDSDMLRNLPATRSFVAAVESPQEQAVRLATLGQPTMRGRRDLAKHFVVSAYLTAALGTQAAEAAGLAKELLDAQGTSGFSFADLAADRAGILFAGGVMKRHFSLPMVAESFAVDSFLPSVEALPEGLSSAQLGARYGSTDGERFQTQLQLIRRRILKLPPYQLISARSPP